MNQLKRGIALLAVGAFLTTGCTSLQPVALPGAGQSSAQPDVKVGDSVVVTTRQGQTQKFTVTAVESEALVGRNVRIPFADIASLDARRSDPHATRTALIAGAVAVGVAAIAAASGGSGGGGGY